MKKILHKFKPLPGYHAVSNSIRKILRYYDYDLEEEMIFGLASALDFCFVDLRQNQLPHIYGRVRPGEFEKNLSDITGMKIVVKESAVKKRAFDEVIKMIDKGHPVMIYVDVAYMPYLKIPDFYHFGAHSVVLFGYDDEQKIVYVSDRDAKGFSITMSKDEQPDDYHILSYDNLILARASKEKHQPPKNRWLKFKFDEFKQQVTPEMIKTAITRNAENMVGNTIKNIGVEGIELFSQKVSGWKNLDDETLHKSAYDAFTMIDKVGSTGGGCYRKIYGNFLRASGDLLDDDFIYQCGVEFLKTADIWDDIAARFYDVMTKLERDKLSDISPKLLTIALREKELFLRMKEHLTKG